jgi:segregation and condensation protein B
MDAPAPLPPFEQAVEALLFASDVPLRAEDLAAVLAEVWGEEVEEAAFDAAVEALNQRYAAGGHAFRIRRLGGGWRHATLDTLAPVLRTLFTDDRDRRLSTSLLESLAVVAYRQPVTKPEIDHVRGVNSDYALRGLLERGLIDIDGRSDSVGRPLLYATTPAFLDLFGLGSLDDLPKLREIEEILTDPSFHRERSRLLSELAAAAAPAGDPDARTPDA